MTTTPVRQDEAVVTSDELQLVLFVGQTCEDDDFYDNLHTARTGASTNLHIVDVWDDPASAIAFNVLVVPTLVTMRDGVEIGRLCGRADVDTIRRTIGGQTYC